MCVQLASTYSPHDKDDDKVTWLLNLSGIRRDLYPASFEIVAYFEDDEATVEQLVQGFNSPPMPRVILPPLQQAL